MYAVVNYILHLGHIIFTGYLFTQCLTVRWKKIPKWIYIIGFAVCFQLLCYGKFLIETGSLLENILYYLIITLFLVFLSVVYSDVWWKKVLLVILLLCNSFIAEFAQKALCPVDMNNKVDSPRTTIAMLIGYTVYISACFLIILVWKMCIRGVESLNRRNLPVLILIPVGQLLVISSFRVDLFINFEIFGTLCICGSLIGFLADMVVMYLLQEQDEKQKAEEQLKELETLWEMEKDRYARVQKQQEKVAKLRHDFNNHIAVLQELIANKEVTESQQILDELIEELHNYVI